MKSYERGTIISHTSICTLTETVAELFMLSWSKHNKPPLQSQVNSREQATELPPGLAGPLAVRATQHKQLDEVTGRAAALSRRKTAIQIHSLARRVTR